MISTIVKAIFLVGIGMLEGYVFARAGVLPPQVMEDQMVFRSFLIMKMFLSAVGASMIFQAIMSILTPNAFSKSRFYGMRSVGLVRIIIGSTTLGVGMTLAGSGPTMLPSQIAIGVNSAPSILGGILTGGLLFAIVEPFIFDVETCSLPPKGSKMVAEDIIGGSYALLATLGGIGMLTAVVLMEVFLPHREEVRSAGVPISNPTLPIFCGIVIGANQIPLRYITEDGQGGSTSPISVIATLTGGLVAKRHQIKDIVSAAQLLYVWGGSLLGAYAGSDLLEIDGFSFARSFIGGFCMILGARLANGCTCGIGISGMSEISLHSIVGTCCIFGGAIVTGMIAVYAV